MSPQDLEVAITWPSPGRSPPEDAGGRSGYTEFLRVLFNPEEDEIEEQRHLKRWSGSRFDLGMFDLSKTDKAVRGALRKRRER